MPEEYVPPVVAVVVTAEADAWLEQCLESLEQQNYPSLDVLVIDTGTSDGVTNRVAGVMPSAFVRRRPDSGGFGAAANDVLVGIEGASFFLFCHEDVALAPDAIRVMVEEAFRSNAGIVGPKLVEWDAPAQVSPAANSTWGCSRICRPLWTPAAKTASFILLLTMARCFARRCA